MLPVEAPGASGVTVTRLLPVPQEPRQATAATQPIPRGDAFVPQHLDLAPEGYPLVNGVPQNHPKLQGDAA